MSNIYKNMKFPNIEKGKVLTLDEEGKLIASSNNVSDLSTTEYVDTKISEVQAAIGDVTTRLQSINGETTE